MFSDASSNIVIACISTKHCTAEVSNYTIITQCKNYTIFIGLIAKPHEGSCDISEYWTDGENSHRMDQHASGSLPG